MYKNLTHCPENLWRKLSWKRAETNCTAVSEGGKIQNTMLRIEHSTFFGQWKGKANNYLY